MRSAIALEWEKSASSLIAPSTPLPQNGSAARAPSSSAGVTASKQHPHSTHSWSSGLPLYHECVERGCCLLAVTPADDLAARAADPFCGSGVLGAINELADFSHSKAIADLISDGNPAKDRLILTLGRIGPPRYANFIGRWRDDADPEIRRSVASALGSLDNPGVTIPVLIQLLARGTAADAFAVKWEASESLVRIAKRPGGDAVRPRLVALLGDPDGVTAALAARTLAAAGDARGVSKLREVAG